MDVMKIQEFTGEIEMFTSTSDALEALIEELYDSANDINPMVIHEAILFISKKMGLDRDYEELLEAGPDLLNIVHEKRVDDAIDDTKDELRLLIYDIFEG